MVEIYHTINLVKKIKLLFFWYKKKKIGVVKGEITKLTFVGVLDRWVGV